MFVKVIIDNPSSQTDIGFVHQGVLYLKRFASAT